MKPKALKKRLELNKKTIADLNDTQMVKVNGGIDPTEVETCTCSYHGCRDTEPNTYCGESCSPQNPCIPSEGLPSVCICPNTRIGC